MREGNSSLTPRDAGASDTLELPEDLRAPLHSLMADVGYLFGRVAADGSMAGMMTDSAETRLSHVAEAAYRLNGLKNDLLEALKEAQAFINRFEQPITSPSRSYWLRVSDVTNSAIAKAEGGK